MTHEPTDRADARPRATTIYDVARHLGVSPSAVSRALNKPGRMSADTEARIRRAAAELGYRTNPLARALPTGRTATFGLVLSDITNPVYFDVIRGAEDATTGSGRSLLMAESQESPETERTIVDRMIPSTDGIVLVGSRLDDEEIVRLAAERRIVVVNRDVEGVACVVPDPTPGIVEALQLLAATGHRELGYLSGPRQSWMNGERWRIVDGQAARYGLSATWIDCGDPGLEGGRASLDPVLRSGVDAVLCYNDLMAIGLLLEAAERDVDVPGEFGVIGFDDIFGASFTTPPLTTIRSPLTAAGRLAVEHLIDGRDPSGMRATELRTTLVRRSSDGPRSSAHRAGPADSPDATTAGR